MVKLYFHVISPQDNSHDHAQALALQSELALRYQACGYEVEAGHSLVWKSTEKHIKGLKEFVQSEINAKKPEPGLHVFISPQKVEDSIPLFDITNGTGLKERIVNIHSKQGITIPKHIVTLNSNPMDALCYQIQFKLNERIYLLEAGVSTDQKDTYNLFLLMNNAARRGDKRSGYIANILAERALFRNEDQASICLKMNHIHHAAATGDLERLTGYADQVKTAYQGAVENLRFFNKPDFLNKTPLFYALKYNQPTAATLLVEKCHVSLQARLFRLGDRTLEEFALFIGEEEVVKALRQLKQEQDLKQKVASSQTASQGASQTASQDLSQRLANLRIDCVNNLSAPNRPAIQDFEKKVANEGEAMLVLDGKPVLFSLAATPAGPNKENSPKFANSPKKASDPKQSLHFLQLPPKKKVRSKARSTSKQRKRKRMIQFFV